MENTLSYRYIPINDLTTEQLSQFRLLSSICFPESKDPKEKANHNDRFFYRKDRVGAAVALSQDQIIAKVYAIKRIIKYKSKNIVLGGIGGVCTNTNMRRKGIATALLKIAMQKLEDESCDIAFLCTDTKKLGKLYKPFGFQKLETKYTYLGKSGKRYYEWDGMIAPIKSSEIFKEILQDKNDFDIGVGNW